VTETIDLDHTSFAVDDALAWARRLRRDLGATPIAGEVLPAFRYVLLYVGTVTSGARIELLDPVGDGFLTRFLERHGTGPHHLTFTVPDLREPSRRPGLSAPRSWGRTMTTRPGARRSSYPTTSTAW
jgi:hypothetical protein